MNLKRASFLAGTFTLVSGLVCLLGWLWRPPLLLALVPKAAVMAPNSALCFTLAGLTLLLLAQPTPGRRLLARGATGFVAIICCAHLLELGLGRDWGVDEFFISYLDRLPGYADARMASVSAISFLLLAAGFAFLLWRGRIWAGDALACALALVVGIVGLVFIAGYLVGEPVLFAFDPASMAATTAVLFVVLAAGLLCVALTEEFAHTHHPFVPLAGIPVEKKLSAGAGAAFGIVVLMGLLSYNNTVKFIGASRWVEHAQRMLTVLEDTLSNLAVAESNERGYILTGQESFLEPCRVAMDQSRRRGELLLLLTADYPESRKQIARLLPLVEARLTALRQLIDLRRTGQLEPAVQIVAEVNGRGLMERVRQEAEAFRALARAQLAERAAAREASRRRTLFTFAAAAVIVAAILLGVHFVVERDLSGRRRAEAALQRHNETLRGFAHTVAHDLRAPLRGIEGYARELRTHHGASLGERGRHCADQITAAAANLDQLVQDTLEFARLDGETVSTAPVDLPALVAALLRQREPQIREHGAEITTAFPVTHVTTWPRGLERVLANLLDNALKYSRRARPPRIGLATAETATDWLLTVRDNGIGFEMRHHDRLFGLFHRLPNAAGFEGTGAGLAIAKKITDRLGGTLRAESAPGEGAAFFVQLPKAAAGARV